ncbi:hypothetical protein D3C81_1698960 [compost metagenome]
MCHFNGYTCFNLRQDNGISVGFVLLVEQIPAWQAYYANMNAFFCKSSLSLHSKLYFRTRSDKLCYRFTVFSFRYYVSATFDAFTCKLSSFFQDRQVLTSQYKRYWISFILYSICPCSGSFITVSWTKHSQTWNDTQGCKLFDWFVSRTIFTNCDTVMRKHESYRQLHQ